MHPLVLETFSIFVSCLNNFLRIVHHEVHEVESSLRFNFAALRSSLLFPTFMHATVALSVIKSSFILATNHVSVKAKKKIPSTPNLVRCPKASRSRQEDHMGNADLCPKKLKCYRVPCANNAKFTDTSTEVVNLRCLPASIFEL